MRNQAYQVDYCLAGDNPDEWTLTQYVVFYDPDTELGKILDASIFETPTSEEERLAKLDTYLREHFGFGEDEVAFYYGTTHEMTEQEMRDGLKADGDIIIIGEMGQPFYENEKGAN